MPRHETDPLIQEIPISGRSAIALAAADLVAVNIIGEDDGDIAYYSMARAGNRTYGLWVGDALAGVACLSRADSQPYTELHYFVINKEHRRRHLGSYFLSVLEGQEQALGSQGVTLLPTLASRAFYTYCNYVQDDRMGHFIHTFGHTGPETAD